MKNYSLYKLFSNYLFAFCLTFCFGLSVYAQTDKHTKEGINTMDFMKKNHTLPYIGLDLFQRYIPPYNTNTHYNYKFRQSSNILGILLGFQYQRRIGERMEIRFDTNINCAGISFLKQGKGFHLAASQNILFRLAIWSSFYSDGILIGIGRQTNILTTLKDKTLNVYSTYTGQVGYSLQDVDKNSQDRQYREYIFYIKYGNGFRNNYSHTLNLGVIVFVKKRKMI